MLKCARPRTCRRQRILNRIWPHIYGGGRMLRCAWPFAHRHAMSPISQQLLPTRLKELTLLGARGIIGRHFKVRRSYQ